MQSQQTLEEWKKINYSKSNNNRPIERWGHQIVLRENYEEIYLFGGYGSKYSTDGKYFNDLWMFSTNKYEWQEVNTTGQIPQAKSNYSFHYNNASDEIILFGGGGDNKARYNSVFILNCKNKRWRKYTPQLTEQAPWERTYHTSEFVYPYLIVHGGQSISNMDLNDMWVFNVETKKWRLIEFENQANIPISRRFHSSFMWNNHFYIIGGCNYKYSLIGDVHRVDLKELFEKHKYDGYNWQCLVSKSSLLERWGHTCNLINGKVYIVFGRISLFADSNQTIVFDLENNQIKALDLSKENLPKPRRRHSSVVINDCLLILGGYNGGYLNDFHYLKIQNPETTIKSAINVQLLDNLKELQSAIKQFSLKKATDIQIRLMNKNTCLTLIKTNKQPLLKNAFFKNFIKYSEKDRIIFQMPLFCNEIIFKVIHLCITENILLIPLINNIQFYKKLVQSCNYFTCDALIDAIQQELINNINEDNYDFAFNIAIQLNFKNLIKKAAEISLSNQGLPVQTGNLTQKSQIFSQSIIQCQAFDDHQMSNQLIDKRRKAIEQIYRKNKFIIEQAQLKEQNTHCLLRTARKIKQIFNKTTNNKESKSKNPLKTNEETKENEKGCFSKFISYLFNFCTNSNPPENQER